MTVLYLVRHAKPAATWGEATDPGIDELGRTQAEQTAQKLRVVGPLPIYTSPLKRCRETAEPLAALWSTEAKVLNPVSEIPSPPLTPAERQKWLHDSMVGTWAQLQANAPAHSPDFSAWRVQLLQSLAAMQSDCVIFSHYIAINVAVGAAQNHDRVLSFRPGHASVTTIEFTQGQIILRELGTEAEGGLLLGR